MKIFICLLMLSLSLITGCSKTGSTPAAKLIGDWNSERGNVKCTFSSDNTGLFMLGNEKNPIKWSASEDGTFKVTDASETIIVHFEGDKLAMGGSHNYFVKVK